MANKTTMELTRENIAGWAKKYDEERTEKDRAVEEKMKEKLTKQRFLSKDDLVEIGMWKSPRAKKRYEANDDEVVRELTKFSFAAMTEWARIGALCALSGVSFPVASAILHFAFPELYPIFDSRALESLGKRPPKSYNYEFWWAYCKQVRGIAEDLSLPLRKVDKALWQYSKEKTKTKHDRPTSHY